MSRFYRILYLLITILTFITTFACSKQIIRTETGTPETVTYRQVLGKSVSDEEVIDFIVDHRCSSAAQFQLCKDIGVALLIGKDHIVETVYLYLNHAQVFSSYAGDLPLGLKFYDTLGAVEYKLDRQGVGNAGKPDEGSAPDHFHYRAVYKQAGVTVLYNAPYPDEDATIYAILVSSQQLSFHKERVIFKGLPYSFP